MTRAADQIRFFLLELKCCARLRECVRAIGAICSTVVEFVLMRCVIQVFVQEGCSQQVLSRGV